MLVFLTIFLCTLHNVLHSGYAELLWKNFYYQKKTKKPHTNANWQKVKSMVGRQLGMKIWKSPARLLQTWGETGRKLALWSGGTTLEFRCRFMCLLNYGEIQRWPLAFTFVNTMNKNLRQVRLMSDESLFEYENLNWLFVDFAFNKYSGTVLCSHTFV